MYKKINSALILLTLTGLFVKTLAADFYISPMGSDLNAGTKQSPFLTIERARQACSGFTNEACTIWLNDGIYTLEKPVVFNVAAYKNAECNLAIKALPGTNPVVSGGKQITNWQKNTNGQWEATYKAEKAPRELFVGEKRAIRARFPNSGYLRIGKVGADRRTHFFFSKNEFPVPESTKNVEVIVLHDWSISRIGVKAIDKAGKRLTAVDSIGARQPSFFNLDHWEEHPRYFLENAPEFLDAFYEWYFNPENGKITIMLPDSVQPNNVEITVPVSDALILIEGEKNKRIKNIHFEGITFKHCAWQIPEMGYCGVQACHYDARPDSGWAVVPAAIKVAWAENITFENCTVKNLGTSGLWFSNGCINNRVENSFFFDVSGNGIMIGEGRDRLVDGNPWWKEAPEQVALKNSIKQCTLENCGAQFYGAVGIWCGLTANTTIKNCRIYNLPYSGISIGWMWSPEPTPCRDNLIEDNYIHHVMCTLSDGGGIYSLGLQPGSKILNNHIHDVQLNAGRAESNGMFLDEGTTNVVIAGNLIYNIAKSPLRFHKATKNLVEQNLLFCKNNIPPIRYNRTEESDILKIDNKIFFENETSYPSMLNDAIKQWKNEQAEKGD